MPTSPTPLTIPAFTKGEHYAGLIVINNTPTHHLVLLPGDTPPVDFQSANDWAKERGGELPTRNEQALLFANCKSQFKPVWYWSSAQPASDSRYAWFQVFTTGYQGCNYVDNTLRARAVRRISI